jgi:AraC-like DNA-binding protein/ligand-binding sensor protein
MQTTFANEHSGAVSVRPDNQNGASAGDKAKTLMASGPANGNGNGNGNDRALIEMLSKSKIYQDYERAFSETTALPMALHPVESWQLPLHGKRHENPFCEIMSRKSRACAACLQVQEKLRQRASLQPETITCQHGLSDTAVPVRLGDRLIGFLQTGQIFRKKPTQAQFENTARLAADWGVAADREELKKAYFNTPVLSNTHYESVVRLLGIFAQHLSVLSNQIAVQQCNTEPLAITRAREFIQEHQTEDLSLGQVAKAVNMSTFYFCKMFKKITGVNFTDYLSRVRIEKSKNLLLNPNLRVSEIAFEVGFQSLTHFNRVFKKILGQSPTEYRSQTLGVA